MPISFVPERSRVLFCDFNMAGVPPEMRKRRRVVVVSPRSHNHRHGNAPGRCIVVPFSATDPGKHRTPADVEFPVGVYDCLTVFTWALCGAATLVSHDRLDRVKINGAYSQECISADDMQRIEIGLRHAFGFPAI